MDPMLQEYPLEAALVMQRGVEVGIGFSLFSLSHCIYGIGDKTPVIGGVHELSGVDFWLLVLAWTRLVCALPRPLYWRRTRRELKSVRRGASPQEVARRLRRFQESYGSSSWSIETYLLYTFYIWLGVTLILTAFHDSALSRVLWKHCWLNVFLLFLHRVLCVAYFFYLTNSDMPRGVSLDVLDSVTRVRVWQPQQPRDAAVAEEAVPECGICYGDFEHGNLIRTLPCRHEFHKFCIDPWVTNHQNKCPLCLAVLELDDKIDYFCFVFFAAADSSLAFHRQAGRQPGFRLHALLLNIWNA